ncbi:hypothetical protein FRC00_001328 [Tulasnella sp. 408]|nr:hypothetical protein FRC00_001328 [Tulasnella sp. 408]
MKDEAGEGFDRLVAVKQLRPGGDQDERTVIAVRLARELQLWSTLSHKHILVLIGFCFNAELDDAWLISPYESHGNILEYMALCKPDSTERLRLVKDTADALAYLHSRSPPVIHGDLKASNVLVNQDRRAILCDFGLSKALSDTPSGLSTTRALKGSLRYISPELLSNEKRSVHSDMWAWGCLAFEIITDLLPYKEVGTDYAVILKIASGMKPGSLDEHPVPPLVRDVVHNCWHEEADQRPPIRSCKRTLARCLGPFDTVDEPLDESDSPVSELPEEISPPDSALMDAGNFSENESFDPAVFSDSPENSAVLVPMPLRPLVPANAPRPRPILRKESRDSESSNAESELSVMSNDGTASAKQLSSPKPDVRPPFFPEVPVRRPRAGVYEWLAVEAALMESEDEDESDDADDEDDTSSKEEVRIRRYRPGVTFDLPHDEEAATSADESVRLDTPPRSPGVPTVRHPPHRRVRRSSPPPRLFSPSNSDNESSSRPIPLVRQRSPLATSPMSIVPPALPSPPPAPSAPPPPPPPPLPVAELPATLSDDLVTQVKNHCRAAAGSVDWQELDAARQHLRAALAILEGTTKPE